jgi:hypothetical protein
VVIWNKNTFSFFTFFPTSALKKIAIFMRKKMFSLFLFHPPLHHCHCKYGAPKQAKHEQINVFGPDSEQNFIPKYIFILSSAQIF